MPGPLVACWGSWSLEEPRAGASTRARAEVDNAGTAAWRDDILASYHWLDAQGNPIVWDGERTPLPRVVEPGERVELEVHVRAPIPPGAYRFALDLVAEHRAWFGELGGEAPQSTVDVMPRVHAERLADVADVHVPEWCKPEPGWEERVLAAHAEGYAAVAGAVEAPRRLRKKLQPWAPGTGRVPGFDRPLLCPSVLRDVSLRQLPDVEGLPAFAPPPDEPWLYDGNLVLSWR